MSTATTSTGPAVPHGDPHGEHAAHGPAHLQHHFDSVVQQRESATQGMWLFLATEFLLFAGLFCAYAVYRALHPEIFLYAHMFLDPFWGAFNTVVLILSSFTMAAGVWAIERGKKNLCAVLLALTILGGVGFMCVKYVEYRAKWQHGMLWGKYYDPDPHYVEEHLKAHGHTEQKHATPETGATLQPHANVKPPPAAATSSDAPHPTFAAPSEAVPTGTALEHPAPPQLSVEQRARNVQLFFSVYFGMTGLHGLHVLAGMITIAWVLRRVLRGEFSAEYHTPVHMTGLYWHVVDLIWIYLFPLLYLIH